MNRTRAEYESDVSGPGKFEGEQPVCPYFYDQALEGFADESFGATDFFVVSDDDRAFWRGTDWLDGVYGVAVTTTDQGFTVLTGYESQADYDAAVRIESEADPIDC